jgi:hypothetical protein
MWASSTAAVDAGYVPPSNTGLLTAVGRATLDDKEAAARIAFAEDDFTFPIYPRHGPLPKKLELSFREIGKNRYSSKRF